MRFKNKSEVTYKKDHAKDPFMEVYKLFAALPVKCFVCSDKIWLEKVWKLEHDESSLFEPCRPKLTIRHYCRTCSHTPYDCLRHYKAYLDETRSAHGPTQENLRSVKSIDKETCDICSLPLAYVVTGPDDDIACIECGTVFKLPDTPPEKKKIFPLDGSYPTEKVTIGDIPTIYGTPPSASDTPSIANARVLLPNGTPEPKDGKPREYFCLRVKDDAKFTEMIWQHIDKGWVPEGYGSYLSFDGTYTNSCYMWRVLSQAENFLEKKDKCQNSDTSPALQSRHSFNETYYVNDRFDEARFFSDLQEALGVSATEFMDWMTKPNDVLCGSSPQDLVEKKCHATLYYMFVPKRK